MHLKYFLLKILSRFGLFLVALSFLLINKSTAENSLTDLSDDLIGPSVRLNSHWFGDKEVSKTLSILVMAGHADSQGLAGSGTSGEAVALKGALPMDSKISDELFWNLRIRDAVARIGKTKGLNIAAYDPGIRNIVDGNHPKTNWSVGARHARSGGYPLEIHFDSYGEHGFGSGLIPAITRNLNKVDESLANRFGRYPLFFRGGLGAPRREIRVLEIGKLEGRLEASLRNINSREDTINAISLEIVKALLIGLSMEEED